MRALIARLRDDRGSGEDGATLVFVVLVLFTLLAFSALAVDTAGLVQERRELQNGADASADAVARECASTGDCRWWDLADLQNLANDFANDNADDGRSQVSLCGSGDLPDCPTPPPSIPSGAGTGYVQATTRTGTVDGSNRVPFHFARLFGQTGQAVTRQATVIWGGPKKLRTLPFALSKCDFDFPPTIPGLIIPGDPIYLGGDNPTEYCDRMTPAGLTVPGGFGWLTTINNADCLADTTVGDWVPIRTGNTPPRPACTPDDFADYLGEVIAIPIYDGVMGVGAGATYQIIGYAPYRLTQYYIAGGPWDTRDVPFWSSCGPGSAYDLLNWLPPSSRCLDGEFLKDQIIPDGTVGGPSLGYTTFQFVQ